jgi:hypothetical protein
MQVIRLCYGVGFAAILFWLGEQFSLVAAYSHNSVTVTPLAAATVTPVDNLEVATASYLGSTGSDQLNAVDIALDGTIIVGGRLPSYTAAGVTPTVINGGTDGAVLRLDGNGRTALSLTKIGAVVTDLEMTSQNQLVVCGDFGLALLNATADQARWQHAPGQVNRCAIGTDGVVAGLVGAVLYLYDGTQLRSWTVAGSAVYDVAVAGAEQLVIATGYTQLTSNLQVAFIRAWRYDGSEVWRSYDYPAVTGYGADTRGERIAIGQDGLLYFAGTINGGTGASIFSRDPKDLNQSAAAKTVKFDRFNDPTNTGSIKMTWYGRYTPATGDLILGQSLLTRLTNGKGNSITPQALMADETGRLYVAGSKAADLERRAERQVDGQAVGAYESGEGYLLEVAADFRSRIVWTPFARNGFSAGNSPVNALGVRNGVAALVLTQDNSKERRLITTAAALQAEPPGGASDGYLVVWPQVGAPAAPTNLTVSPSIGFVGENRFVATVQPNSVALPITYTWSVNGAVVQTTTAAKERTDSLTYTWNQPANQQTLTVAIQTTRGMLTATYTFDVIAAKRLYLPFIVR